MCTVQGEVLMAVFSNYMYTHFYPVLYTLIPHPPLSLTCSVLHTPTLPSLPPPSFLLPPSSSLLPPPSFLLPPSSFLLLPQKPHGSLLDTGILSSREQQESCQHVHHHEPDLRSGEGRGRILVHGLRITRILWLTVARGQRTL